MEFKKFNQKYILKIEKGEEVIQTITKFCQVNDIKLGTISGIGATSNVTLAFFSIQKKKFYYKNLKEDLEITSLVGNITTMEGNIYLHLHINLSDKNFNGFGGHLKECFVGATLEVIVEEFEGDISREYSGEIGLNLLKF